MNGDADGHCGFPLSNPIPARQLISEKKQS